MDDINILLLGETGVGKSTFINSFANYIKYHTLQDALQSDLVCLIPTKFTITDDDYEEHQFAFGEDDGNEDHNAGNSSTQEAKEHVFDVPGIASKVRIIDTPGVGDARGIEQDEKNIRKTVEYLKRFKHLNAICFVLKPSVTILSEYFKFCVMHLFSCVDKTAGSNILFTFTNSRSTFYRPGETMTLLQKLIREVAENPPYVQIPFSKKNIFCVDNEAFRYLVAMKNGHIFTDKVMDDFSESWLVSSICYMNMLDYIIGGDKCDGLQPHVIIHEVTAIQVRDRLQPLVKIIIDVYLTIARHISYLTDRQRRLCRKPAKNELTIPGLDHFIETMDLPMIVCKSPQCDELSKLGVYKQKCHVPCTCDIRTRDEIYKCSAMDSLECKKCTCEVRFHSLVYYVGRHFEKPRIRQPPWNDEDKNEVWFMEEMTSCIKEYDTELSELRISFAKLDYFLKESLIFGGSYEILNRLKTLYDCNIKNTNAASSIANIILQLKQEHERNLHRMNDKGHRQTVGEVNDVIEDLYQMKHVGMLLSRIERGKREEGAKITETVASSVPKQEALELSAKNSNARTSIIANWWDYFMPKTTQESATNQKSITDHHDVSKITPIVLHDKKTKDDSHLINTTPTSNLQFSMDHYDETMNNLKSTTSLVVQAKTTNSSTYKFESKPTTINLVPGELHIDVDKKYSTTGSQLPTKPYLDSSKTTQKSRQETVKTTKDSGTYKFESKHTTINHEPRKLHIDVHKKDSTTDSELATKPHFHSSITTRKTLEETTNPTSSKECLCSIETDSKTTVPINNYRSENDEAIFINLDPMNPVPIPITPIKIPRQHNLLTTNMSGMSPMDFINLAASASNKQCSRNYGSLTNISGVSPEDFIHRAASTSNEDILQQQFQPSRSTEEPICDNKKNKNTETFVSPENPIHVPPNQEDAYEESRGASSDTLISKMETPSSPSPSSAVFDPPSASIIERENHRIQLYSDADESIPEEPPKKKKNRKKKKGFWKSLYQK